VAVALGFAAWTMTAAAGNPHGTPPGQQQASGSTAVSASSNAHVPAKAQGKAQAKGSVAAAASVKAQGHAASSTKTTGSARAAVRSSVHASTASSATVQTATSAGVKPSSTTTHDTHELASSNKTKLYGNGQTAGQIAGSGNAMLHGPGNSQPHKVMCGPHEIDVHALKAHAAKCAAAAAAAGVAASVSAAVSAQPSVASSAAGQAPTTAAAAKAAAAAKGAKAKAAHKGGVLGAKAQLASATKHVSRAILATAKGTLPFTGFGLALPILLGLALIAGGYGLRRRAAVLS
jgi:hypothetical protein